MSNRTDNIDAAFNTQDRLIDAITSYSKAEIDINVALLKALNTHEQIGDSTLVWAFNQTIKAANELAHKWN